MPVKKAGGGGRGAATGEPGAQAAAAWKLAGRKAYGKKQMGYEKKLFIEDIVPSRSIREVFLLADATLRQARNGPYWSLRLQDATGSVEAKIWSPLSQSIGLLSPGMFVEVTGTAELYNDQLGIKITQLRILDGADVEELEKSRFLRLPPRKPQEMYERLLDLVKKTIVYRPLKKLMLAILDDVELREALQSAFAAKHMHHAYPGGLLEHTLSVAELAMAIADHYPALDRQILLAGAICHDLGKLKELATSGLTAEYTDEGQLMGHIQLGLQLLERFLHASELDESQKTHLRHLVLSHHGLLEYGSPKVPMTAEALILHFADNIDAKLAQIGRIFEEAGVREGGWSAYQKGLERPLYFPVPIPGRKKESGVETRKAEEKADQCSLLLKE